MQFLEILQSTSTKKKVLNRSATRLTTQCFNSSIIFNRIRQRRWNPFLIFEYPF
jgi:hypothetical protein